MSVPDPATTPAPVHPPYEGPEDAFSGRCPVCGDAGRFVRDRMSISESYRCPSCRGHLRYQVQARAVLRACSRHGARSVSELVAEPEFRAARILEPGTLGPFRRLFRGLDGYVQTVFDPNVARGERVDGLPCEDLMALTFAAGSFDLVLTSDVFEHVRDPRAGFAEVFRVLRPGGAHVFTVPGRWPLPPATVPRVDVSGAADVHLLPPVFHNRTHLVYNDFGLDLLAMLDDIGFVTEPILFASSSPTTSLQAAFCSMRPLPTGASAAVRVPAREDVVRRLRRHGRRVRSVLGRG